MLFLFLFLFFTFVFAGVGSFIVQRRQGLEVRIERFLQYEKGSETIEKPIKAKGKRQNFGPPLVERVGKWFAGKSFTTRWEIPLKHAGSAMKSEEFFALKLIVALGVLVLCILLGLSQLTMIILVVLAYKVPDLMMKQRKARRLARCAAQLPSALGSMSTAMRSGFSFMQAMQMIGREVADPLGTEFNQVLREISFGVTMEDALTRLIDRLPSEEVEMIVMALLIQRSTGGNLAEVLDSIKETIQERIRIGEELRALTAQGRASAWVVTLLPVVMALFLQTTNKDYFTPMFHHPLGWGLIAYGVISGVIGWVIMKKIVRIEV